MRHVCVCGWCVCVWWWWCVCMCVWGGVCVKGGGGSFPDSHPQRRFVTAIREVKSHVDAWAAANDKALLMHATVNTAANAAAEAAALRHPAWDSPAQVNIERIARTLRVAAHVLPLWRGASTLHCRNARDGVIKPTSPPRRPAPRRHAQVGALCRQNRLAA